MAETKDIGRVFMHTMRYPETGNPMPRFEHATTSEIEFPYREGRAIAVRVWGSLVLVVGVWSQPDPDAVLDDDEIDRLLSDAAEGVVLDVTAGEIAQWR